ncbi:MAG: DNA-3-methyladenine glycosylase [bacterium]|nr:DNA-3-methyladenine glycosylase [bacterium]
MKKIIPIQYFDQSTLKLAGELLGKFLVRKTGEGETRAMITEVEAYVGTEDKASHASKGRTSRTEVMFGKAGYWYVYMIYGMYYCLNIVTEKEGYPAAILIRSVEGIVGPGRVCKYFKIDNSSRLTINKKPASKKTGIWIEDGGTKIKPSQIKRGIRIGVDYAEEWKEKPWRFYL